jgi:hypothetical protein
VGWDDSFSKDNFTFVPEGDGAWIIRNSWTTGSFEDNQSYYGYFYLSYYDPTIQNSRAHAFEFELADNYDNNYQYDGGMQAATAYAKKAANVFTTASKETLKAVSFYTNSTNADYTVDIYTFDEEDFTTPDGGYLVSSASGKTEYAGYYTVKLDESVLMEKGTIFSVVISIDDDGSYGYFVYEVDMSKSTGWYNITTSAKEGQSYVFSYNSWRDYGKTNNANLKIKAFTDNSGETAEVLPTEIELSGLTDGKLYVAAGKKETVTAKVLPSNATNKKLIWTSSDESVAKVSSIGFSAFIEGVSE